MQGAKDAMGIELLVGKGAGKRLQHSRIRIVVVLLNLLAETFEFFGFCCCHSPALPNATWGVPTADPNLISRKLS